MRRNTILAATFLILISLLVSCNGMSKEEIESKISDSVKDLATKEDVALVSTNANTVSNSVANLQTEVQGIKAKVLDMEEKFERFKSIAVRSSELDKVEQELRAAINAVKEELLVKVTELNKSMALLSTKDEVVAMLGDYVKREEFSKEINTVKESLSLFSERTAKEIADLSLKVNSKASVDDLTLVNQRIDAIIGDTRVASLEKELAALKLVVEEKDKLFEASIKEIDQNNTAAKEELAKLSGRIDAIVAQINLIGDQKEELRLLKERVDKILADQKEKVQTPETTTVPPVNSNAGSPEKEKVNPESSQQGQSGANPQTQQSPAPSQESQPQQTPAADSQVNPQAAPTPQQ